MQKWGEPCDRPEEENNFICGTVSDSNSSARRGEFKNEEGECGVHKTMLINIEDELIQINSKDAFILILQPCCMLFLHLQRFFIIIHICNLQSTCHHARFMFLNFCLFLYIKYIFPIEIIWIKQCPLSIKRLYRLFGSIGMEISSPLCIILMSVYWLIDLIKLPWHIFRCDVSVFRNLLPTILIVSPKTDQKTKSAPTIIGLCW